MYPSQLQISPNFTMEQLMEPDEMHAAQLLDWGLSTILAELEERMVPFKVALQHIDECPRISYITVSWEL
jgi:hypothetical protein